jgi:hypothetical protein
MIPCCCFVLGTVLALLRSSGIFCLWEMSDDGACGCVRGCVMAWCYDFFR